MSAERTVDSADVREPQGSPVTWWGRNRETLLPMPVVLLCLFAVGAFQWGSASAAGLAKDVRFVMVGLVGLPSFLCVMLAVGMGISRGRAGLALHIHDAVEEPTRETVRRMWRYERDRYRRSVSRAQFYAVELGATATLFLTFSALLIERRWSEVASGAAPSRAVLAAASVAAATATAFVVNFVKLLVRLSSYDISARAFSWSTRAVALVAVGDVGLLLVLPISTAPTAILLGVFTGVTGEHTISLLLERAGKSLGFAPAAERGPSPLLCIEGLLPEHVDRLQEEGIFSVHDLALAPTARLFFSTPYGLQMISDWQDQALLLTRWGSDRARDLFDHIGIRGALALRKVARELPESAHESLRRALRLDERAPLEPLLAVIAHDEATRRLEVYAEQSVVLHPAHFDEEKREREEADRCAAPGRVATAGVR